MRRRQAILLLLVSLLAMGFYVATDPSIGLGASLGDRVNTNRVDAARAAWPGTIIGVAGSAVTALTAVWLGMRRMG